MMKNTRVFYSPFSPNNLENISHRALLVQFILVELIRLTKKTPSSITSSTFLPYSWSEINPLDKLKEHAALLSEAFANDDFQKTLEKRISSKKELTSLATSLYLHLKPLMMACKEDEGLLLFLLSRADEMKEIDPNFKSCILEMYPDGIDSLSQYLCQRYQDRGFKAQIARIHELISKFKELT